MRLLRAADRIAVPWKDGGGITRTVAAFPDGADMADFGWRVSIAEVAGAGAFSRFPGVDRILIVLEGRLSLRFVDTDRQVVLAPGRPFAFPGDAAIDATPLDGPVRDLNVMVRRDRWRARVSQGRADPAADGVRIAFADAPPDAPDAVLLDAGEPAPVRYDGWHIRLDPLR